MTEILCIECVVCAGRTLYLKAGNPLPPGTEVEVPLEEFDRLHDMGVIAPIDGAENGNKDPNSDELTDEEKAHIESLIQQVGVKKDVLPAEQLSHCIANLPLDDGTLWTESGKPKVDALENLFDGDVTAELRDEAWELYNQKVQ